MAPVLSQIMSARSRTIATVLVLMMALVVVVAGARVLGSRSTGRSAIEAEAKARADGVVNRLSVVNMLTVPVQLSVAAVRLDQWGRTPASDESPAGLEGLMVPPKQISTEMWLRPLRIADGGGDATFTIIVQSGDGSATRAELGRIDARSTTIEYCPPSGKCFDGYGYIDWADPPDPALDTFRECVVDDRLIGSYVEPAGEVRALHASFQCDARRFSSSLVLHD